MEGHATEASIDRFLTGKLRKTVMVDELFATYLPQFFASREKGRFKLKNCLIDDASFVEGDENVHAYFYFKPSVDPDFELRIEFKDGRVLAKGDGKWGNMGELVDIDEELKAWIANLYAVGIIKDSKKITVAPKDDGSRIEFPVKKHDKDWRDAHQRMNATPRKIAEDIFNIANRIITGIFNWQGKQVEPWNPTEISKGRPTAAPLGPAALGPAPLATARAAPAQASKSTTVSSIKGLPKVPSEEGPSSREPLRLIESSEAEPARPFGSQTFEQDQPQGPALGAVVICPTCGVENPAGTKSCKRCLSPID